MPFLVGTFEELKDAYTIMLPSAPRRDAAPQRSPFRDGRQGLDATGCRQG
jgi:hypothetical protein